MNRQKRQQVHNKFNGKCAYTGQTLDSDWQIDHSCSQFEWGYFNKSGDVNHIDNLLPALRVVNHYKRSKNLEQFRSYMLSFHTRLAKLPKKTTVEATRKRIEYMNKIANAFGISVDKPFDGKFYFERSSVEHNNECAQYFELFKEILIRESVNALSTTHLIQIVSNQCDIIINKCKT